MPKRQVFFSFHYKADAWRAAQVRNMGVVEGNKPVSDNDWEQIKRGGDEAIKRWIDEQMGYRSCVVVLIGNQTAGRKWINYEIKKGWEYGKGVVGVYIHNLKDQDGKQALKGKNPFDDFTFNSRPFSEVVRAYDPPFTDSREVYDYIKEHLAEWVEEAIEIRKKYP
ncbi:TIR domain-containing protein [Thermus islandicus]|uniref:TIR domain-containing protein n=1 Tax=Thermus islandicus TaxID=540988 RepID=UPI0003B46B14|nr:TIR domain-containing protein [Thermus islandicus]